MDSSSWILSDKGKRFKESLLITDESFCLLLSNREGLYVRNRNNDYLLFGEEEKKNSKLGLS